MDTSNLVRPGLRAPDLRSHLEATPSRRQLGNLDSLQSLLFPGMEDETASPNSSGPELLHYSMFSVVCALSVLAVWPNHTLWNICFFPVCSPMSLIHIWIGMNVAYTDMRDVAAKNYTDSIVSLAAYVGTMLAPHLISSLWHLNFRIVLFIWTNTMLTTTCCSLICALLYAAKKTNLVSPSLIVRAKEYSHVLQARAITEITNIGYVIFILVSALWRYTAAAMSTTFSIVWMIRVLSSACFGSRLRKQFSYSELPPVEEMRREDGISFRERLDARTENQNRPKIRLLRLKRKLPFLGPRADLVVYALQDAPPYHAISYVWSHGPQDLRTIVLNNMEFQIRSNVYDILQRCNSFFGPRLIWIDSICIDQENRDEKSLQVRKMQDIYKSAGHVLVCLGNASDAGLAFQMIWELNMVEKLGRTYLSRHVSTFVQRQRYDRLLRARVNTFLDLLHHAWFERVWVIQEVVVARHVTIFYGQHSMPLFSFHQHMEPLRCGPVHGVLRFLNSSRSTERPGSPFTSLAKLAFLVGYRLEYKVFGPKPLYEGLRLFISWKATEKIDKIFAFVGLVQGVADRQFLKGLVDYERPDRDIILELARHAVETGNILDILDLTGIGWARRDPTLPSWVVDWRPMESQIPLRRPLTPDIEYKAAVDKESEVSSGENERELIVKGQYIDRIKLLASDVQVPPQGEQPRVHAISPLIGYLDEMDNVARASVPDPYPYMENQTLRDAAWRTITGDRTFQERPAPASYGNVLTTQINLLRSMERYLSLYGPDVLFNPPPELRADITQHFGSDDSWEETFYESNAAFQNIEFLFDNPAHKRRFCVTERGYIGMVPQLSEVGDVVCVLFGGVVPFILRKCDGAQDEELKTKYQLVGESYVHGMMDGQAFELGYSETDFTLV